MRYVLKIESGQPLRMIPCPGTLSAEYISESLGGSFIARSVWHDLSVAVPDIRIAVRDRTDNLALPYNAFASCICGDTVRVPVCGTAMLLVADSVNLYPRGMTEIEAERLIDAIECAFDGVKVDIGISGKE